jgi:exosome complex RNA-binding protein Rrp4
MGTVEITNKLIIVNAIKSRYQPQTGDIVVGRIVEVKIFINIIDRKQKMES